MSRTVLLTGSSVKRSNCSLSERSNCPLSGRRNSSNRTSGKMEYNDIFSSVSKAPMSSTFHKGQAGRICVVGGSVDYCGAPYFAGISCLRAGGDLVHVICTAEAATPIKCYSPELIVHPILNKKFGFTEEAHKWLERVNALVIGPGAGQDSDVHINILEILMKAKELHLPTVVDADAIDVVHRHKELMAGFSELIVTPNFPEFKRLKAGIHCSDLPDDVAVRAISRALRGVTVVLKGKEDLISNGDIRVNVCTPGSPLRCGGQGDLLSGTMGLFNYWTHRYGSGNLPPTMVAAHAACNLTRKCNLAAFVKLSRHALVSDMINEIPAVFEELFGS